MSRMRLVSVMTFAAFALAMVVSAFPAQQPTTPKKPLTPPGIDPGIDIDPGFVPGQPPPGKPLSKKQIEEIQQQSD